MRKLTTVGLLLLVFVGLAMGQVTLSLPTQTAANGTALALPVQVTGFNHVGSFSLTIQFDKNVLTYTGIANQPTFGIFNSTAAATANTNGTVSISWFSVSPALNIGSGTLLSMLFTYNTGVSAVSFINRTPSSITDSLGTNLTATYTNGQVSSLASTITVGTVRQDPGDAFVPLNGANLKGLGSISLRIAFDTSKVTFVGLTNPALPFNAGTPSPGVLALSWFSTIPYSLNSGKLADLHFTLKKDSSSLTVLGTSQVTDSVGKNLSITYVNGMLAKTPAPPVGITVPTVRGVPGTVAVPINVTGLNNIGSISLKVTYDQTKLTFSQIANFAGSGFVTNTTGGVLSFAWFGTQPLTIGTGKLMDIVFSYTGGSSVIGFNSAQSQFTDALGNNLSMTFSNGVVNQDSVPHFSAVAAKTVAQNDTLSFAVLATDADAGDVLTYSSGPLPSGAAFDPVLKLFGWRPSFSISPAVYNVWFYVSDQLGGKDSTMVAITVTNSNRKPVFTAVTAKTVAQNDTLSFAVSATDPDAGDVLTYTVGVLPSGAAFDPVAKTFGWRPSFSISPAIYNVSFYVADRLGAKDSILVAITVTKTNRKPVFTAVAAKTVAQNDTLSFAVSATDPDTADVLTYSSGILPIGAAFNATTKLFGWRPSFSINPQVFTVWFYVVDQLGAKDSISVAVTVAKTNRKPSFQNVLKDTLINEATTLTSTYTATDPDAGTTFAYSLAAAPSGATITAAGVLTFVVPTSPARSYLVTVVVSDGSLTDTTKATVTINRKPVKVSATTIPTIGVSQNKPFTFLVSASDPDKDALTFTWRLNDAQVKTGGDSTYTVTFPDAHGTVKKVACTFADPRGLKDSVTWTFVITGIGTHDVLPTEFALGQNYPNPFNPTTTIQFDLPKEAPVTMEIYNVLGVRVRELLRGENINAGHHQLMWDGRDDYGSVVPSGVYLYRISAGDFRGSKKMTLLK